MKHKFYPFLILILPLLLLTSCGGGQPIVNHVQEREANEIIVFLASKGITAEKVKASDTGVAAAGGGGPMMWNIYVPEKHSTEAMALLNQYGLPRSSGTNLLELFAKQGLMSSDKEEAIRFQAGLAEELTNIVRKMDGVIDASVQISYPKGETAPGEKPPKMTAAVYIKHTGMLDDPNNHLETKIKRLLAGSVTDLSFDNVAVISDRSRLTDLEILAQGEPLSMKEQKKSMVKMWSVVMTRDSIGHFRTLFITMILLVLLFGGIAIYLTLRSFPGLSEKIPFLKRRKKE